MSSFANGVASAGGDGGWAMSSIKKLGLRDQSESFQRRCSSRGELQNTKSTMDKRCAQELAQIKGQSPLPFMIKNNEIARHAR